MRALLRWPANLLRGLFLFLFALIAAAIYGIGALSIRLVSRGAEARRRRLSRWRGRVLRRSMTMLGATFIKLGQVMSSRPDLLSSEVIDELKLLLDQLPPFAFWRVRRIVEADLGGPLSAFYADFEPHPIAAASVAQVHRARLEDGREVAVKVLRPSVRGKVERDGAILTFFARLLALHPKIKHNDPVGHVHHFVTAIIKQTDLTLEADNYDRFRRNFAGVPEVVFPEVHRELSSRRVLTMELMRGMKFADRDRSRDRELAGAIKRLIFKMAFEDGFLHCDLHPGNFMVSHRHELIVFDVGLASLVEGVVFDQFFDMARSLVLGTADDFVAHMKRFSTYTVEPDWDRFRAEMAAVLPKYRSQNIGELEYMQLFDDMFRISRDFKSRQEPALVMVMVAFLTAQGIGKQLDPDANIFHDVAGFIGPLLARAGRTAQPSAS
jgi:ubiquinone biosynthesis protein